MNKDMRPDDQDHAPAATYDLEFKPLTDSQFQRIQSFVKKESGIHLTDAKRNLVIGRLAKRLRALGLSSYGQYYEYVMSGHDPDEKIRLLDCICTNETHFFREIQHFDYLVKTVFPAWRSRGSTGMGERRIRVWSSACSTGEEPYTLAMVLLENFPRESGWHVEVLATDLSASALARAEEAVWTVEKASEIPSPYLKTYMLRGTGPQQGKMRAGPEIRSVVRFQRMNLCGDVYPVTGPFDLIFCRNVIIYFDRDTRLKVVNQLLNFLSPSGLFLSGHAESLNDLSRRVRSVMPTIYRLTDPPATGREREAA